MTVLIPLVGYLIIFNAKIAEYLQLVARLGGPLNTAEVSPRLLLVYFGLCAVAAAVSIYAWRCPNAVKYYGSANAYVSGVKDATSDFPMAEIERVFTHNNDKFIEEFFEIRDRYKKTNLPGEAGVTSEQRDSMYVGYLHLYYRYLDEEHPISRIAVAVLYSIGFVCLLIPSAGVFWRVCKILWGILTTQARLLF
ncbi:hypothetical protein QA639_21900 [Bradyrhizobium pachyrhizi]|uniref:hypothetical protein n=1 Tax=Bradyrhizobium pachyrhizi TaxID=280333 RepID=UPI0024B13628|nr:hypothetical protein [Bradyrhizobium pachyrhizi]WFU52364.1 hypothetical protein QA639_21900 [Bradyrhizobium pachyrhizi]